MSIDRRNGFVKGADLANNPNVKLIESEDTLGLPDSQTKAFQNPLVKHPDIDAPHPRYGVQRHAEDSRRYWQTGAGG